jgi:hypothetical protein
MSAEQTEVAGFTAACGTILVVEGERAVRTLVTRVLTARDTSFARRLRSEAVHA